MTWTLPSKKASSPGHVDRELALPVLGKCGTRRSSHPRCPYDTVQNELRLCCRLSSPHLLVLRRGDATVQLEETPFRWSVVAWASSSARLVCSASAATST